MVLAAAVHAYAPPERKAGALAGLTLMTGFAALTGGVHFARLAVGRHLTAGATPELAVLRLCSSSSTPPVWCIRRSGPALW